MFYFQSQVTKDHWQSKVLQIASTRMKLIPFAFRIIHFRQDDIEGFPGNVCIFLIAGGKT